MDKYFPDYDAIKTWLVGPTGIMLSRIVATMVKSALVFASAKIPALGLGERMDALVAEFAPMLTVALVVAWTKWQHDKTETRVKAALLTEPPKDIPTS